MADVSPNEASARLSSITLGTRRSQLAIAQVDMIVAQLRHLAPGLEYRTQIISTMADENQSKSFAAFNSKSIWTEELEQLLADKALDIVVHCLKDMPTQLPRSCRLGAITLRTDPRDCVVMRRDSPWATLASLPPGSVIGTSAVRRKAQLTRAFPHLRCEDVRGNVNTRLAKLDAENGPYACLVLAVAGLERLGLEGRITHYLGPEEGVLYAPGQGALGLEVREGDGRVLELVKLLADARTTLECTAEKSLLKTLEGGCSAPVGVESAWEEARLRLRASVISLDGKEIVDMSASAVVGSVEQAEILGRELAERMVESGAAKILQQIRSSGSFLGQ